MLSRTFHSSRPSAFPDPRVAINFEGYRVSFCQSVRLKSPLWQAGSSGVQTHEIGKRSSWKITSQDRGDQIEISEIESKKQKGLTRDVKLMWKGEK
jgi:hypothetical protein